MSRRLPPLHTARLTIRDLRSTGLENVYRILDVEVDMPDSLSKDERKKWLDWSIANYEHLAKLYQPPYGDRGIILRESDELIGVIGYAPMFHPLIEMLDGRSSADARRQPELGLYYAVSPSYHRQGYASEAAQRMVDYAFEFFNLMRIVANTEFENVASQGVMKKIGMTLYHNKLGKPEWFEVLGVLTQDLNRPVEVLVKTIGRTGGLRQGSPSRSPSMLTP